MSDRTTREVDDFNTKVINEFRANAGVVGGVLAGSPLILLTHRGARTGRVRTIPLGYYDAGDELVVFASCMGSPRHPQWFHNLAANPNVTVEVGADRYEATARVVDGAERAEMWDRVVAARPFLAEHQANAGGRVIPLIALER